MSILQLNAAPAAIAKKLDIATETVMKKLVVDLHAGITKRTPVDTGRARASWQLGIGEPSTKTAPESAAEGEGAHKGKSSPPASPEAAPPDISQVDGTRPVYITSNLPYIEALENGHSSQAPAGMVAVTIAEIEAEMKNIDQQLA